MESIVSRFGPFHFIFCRSHFCLKVIFQRIMQSLSNFWKMGGVGGVDRVGERGLSYLFCNFVHCTCQVAHVAWRHTSNGNSAIFGQVDGKFFSKSFHLKSQTSNLAYIIQKKVDLHFSQGEEVKLHLRRQSSRARLPALASHRINFDVCLVFFEVLTCNEISAISASKIDFLEISVVSRLKASL